MDASWQGGGGASSQQMPPFVSQLDGGANHEDWEDWLRWDPALDATSPDDGTFNSGSSKNDSPLQAPAYPGQQDEPLVPPLIVGDDDFGFGNSAGLSNDSFLFGGGIGDVDAGFDFDLANSLNDLPTNLPKLDTTSAPWTLPSNDAPEAGGTLSAFSSDQKHNFTPAASLAATTPSLHHSPASTSHARHSISSNSPDPPKKRGGRKRKAEVEAEATVENAENGETQDGDEPPMKKTSHNVIEKRYRNNLNDKIVELRNSVPSLRAKGASKGGKGTEDLDGLTPAHKLNKATVMAKATEYIKHLETRNQTMADEMAALKAQLARVEAAIGQSRDRQVSMGNGSSPPAGMSRSREASSAGSPSFLNVAQDQSRFGQSAVQQQYVQQQTQPTYSRPPNPPVDAQNQPQNGNGRGGQGFMNKVMLGTMAGIMALEGFNEHGDSGGPSAQQLFSVPTALLKRSFGGPTASSAEVSRQTTISVFKVFLVVGVLLYLLAPLLSFSPRRKPKAHPSVQLPQAPSLASPVEVRRKAWLTAIQTVWVPKHFLHEVVAVGFKMFQLSMRRLIGSEAFTTITGTTKEEEAARIKAWDIAIDAQLAGGDAQVSYYRLLLTLMESGTLPDSPARLMQKAVHFRVFFWEVANAGYGNLIGFKQFTEKVGRIYWASARRLQKELVHAKAQGRPSDEDGLELLPDHLARLGELDCDEVLSDEMIQRAWNLAWNKPSANGTISNAARDSVVEDHAIRSPLDAVAAWYTNTAIDDTLADALSDNVSTFDTEYYIGLALSVAPPASSTHVRALAAKAVLSKTNRDANIIVALEALPVISPTSGMNLVNHAPASPDVCTALTLAKMISLCSPSSPRSARMRAFDALTGLQLAPAQFTLLTAVAAYRLLRIMSSRKEVPKPTEHGLEDLAGSLRVWVGTSSGKNSGLGLDGRRKVVRLCLNVAKQLGGWEEKDSGYVSNSSGSQKGSQKGSSSP